MILEIILIILLILDITVHAIRIWGNIQFNKAFERIKLSQETRRGDNNAMVGRLNNVKYKGHATPEQEAAPETIYKQPDIEPKA